MKPVRPELIALALCAVAVGLEGIAAGRRVRRRLAALRCPPWAPGLGLWMAIGAGYYVVCFMVLRSVLPLPSSGSRTAALTLMLSVMLINACWNWLFFRSRDLWLSFVVGAAVLDWGTYANRSREIQPIVIIREALTAAETLIRRTTATGMA